MPTTHRTDTQGALSSPHISARTGVRLRIVDEVSRDVAEHRMANAELGALHRVATLAAEGVAPSNLFAMVAEEVSRVVDVPRVSVARYEPDDTVITCASFPP
jgi:hypothetical protein